MLYCIDARTDAEGRGKCKDNTGRVKEQSAAVPVLCAGVLLRERAEAKRRGELEQMRNEWITTLS